MTFTWEYEWWELLILSFVGFEIGLNWTYAVMRPDEYFCLVSSAFALHPSTRCLLAGAP